MIRYFICPVDLVEASPGSGDFYRIPRVMTYPTIRTSAAVKPAATWALVAVQASAAQFAVIDGDPQCVDIFEKLSDLAGETDRAGIVAWLKSRTVGDVNTTVRTRIRNRLTAMGVDVTSLTLASTFFDVLKLVFDFHCPGQNLEDMG